MRASVEWGLRTIPERFAPQPDDGWLLVPGDHPVLDGSVVGDVIQEWSARRPAILVPTHQGRRGHPTIFSWRLAAEALALPRDVGLNELVRRHAGDVVEWESPSDAIRLDLDTPEDYERLRPRFGP